MCWSEIDYEKATWTLAANRSKNGKAHTLPLLPMMHAIIKAVPRMASRDQLFGTRGGGFTAWSYGKAALDGEAGVKEGWVVHDVRRSVATRMADLGIMPHVIEQILNHQSGHRRGVLALTIEVHTSVRCAPRWRCGTTISAALSRVASARSSRCVELPLEAERGLT